MRRMDLGYYLARIHARRGPLGALSVVASTFGIWLSRQKGGAMFKWFRNVAIERELTDILDRHQRVRQDASDIRDYLLWVLEQDRLGAEKFSDDALNRAEELYQQVGAGALYWMTDIAAQMVVLSEATLRGFSTNVGIELGAGATAEDIVKKVVQLP